MKKQSVLCPQVEYRKFLIYFEYIIIILKIISL